MCSLAEIKQRLQGKLGLASTRKFAGYRRRLRIEAVESRLLLHGVLSVAPSNGDVNVPVNVDVMVTFDFDADPATLNESTFELRDPQGTLVPGTVTYDAPSRRATLNPNVNIQNVADFYEAKIFGGTSGVSELGGDPLEEDYAWYFITQTPTYSDTEVITGLNLPTAIEFAPDGTVFVAEKSGIIKVFDDLNDTTPTTFADLRTKVHNYWDRGLLGLAVHPDYPSTAEVFALYTYDAPLSGTVAAPAWGSASQTGDPGPGTSGAPSSVSGRLVRLVANGSGVWDGNEHVLVEDWGQQYPSHSIGSLAFGSDGALYASAGDGASFNFADYGQTDDLLDDDPALGDTRLLDPVDEGGALRSLDLLTSPEDPAVDPVSLDGTIIRIDPITGDALPDNPLYDLYGNNDDPNAERIVANGLRNPFRFTIRPGTNELWVGDVGWGTWEEINVVRDPTDSSIDTFGWPAFEGPDRSGYDSLDKPLIEDFYDDVDIDPSLHSEPFYAYRHSDPVLPGGPTGTSSTAGVAFAEGGNLNRAYEGAFFFADYSRDRVWVMFEGVDGEPDPASRGVVLPNAHNPIQLSVGPGGDLFYVNYNDGEIRRIRYYGVDKSPTAVIETDVTFGAAPLTVNFDATASNDLNPGDTLTYAWDLDGDGQLNDSVDPQPSFTYNSSGVYAVTLEVTDSTGLKDTDTVLISVDNTPPTAFIDQPLPGLTWVVGDEITFSGHADDPDEPGGTLASAQLDWEIILHHCPSGCHTHSITSFNGTFTDSFSAPDHEYPSHLEIELTATDPVTGIQSTDSVLVYPQTIDVTLDSSPSGLDLTINGASEVAPFSTTVIVGSNNSISAPTPQVVSSTTYQFDSWSDGGAQSHNYIAGNQNQSLTASYSATAGDTTDAGTGTITAQGENGTAEGKEKAFDNDPGTKWLDFANANPATRASWIQYQYDGGEKYIVDSYTITSANDASQRDPMNWALLGSNDGVNFTVLDTRSNEDFPGRFQTRSFSSSNSTGYNVYRLDITLVANPASANSLQLAEIELIGVPDANPTTPTVTIVADDPTAAEGTPVDPGRFTFTRTGNLSGDLDVNYSIGGTASGGDYAETLSGTVTIADQDASVTIDITPVDDSEIEVDESVLLTLQTGSGYLIGAANVGTVTIVDNDAPIDPFDTTDDGLGTITVQGENPPKETRDKIFDNSNVKWLDFAPANPSTRASWIQYQYAGNQRFLLTSYTIKSANDNPARDPSDWTLSGSNDGVNFTPLDSRSGEIFTSRFQTRSFGIAGGAGYNIYRLEVHSVANPASANSLQLAEIELIGVPDGTPPPPTVSIQATVPGAAEGSPVTPGEFTISRSGSTAGALTVNYTIDGSAATNDYLEPLSGTTIIPDSAGSTVITITPVDDTLSEGIETLQLILSPDSNYTVGAPNTATVTIADDDATAGDTTDAGTGTITAQGENGTAEGKEKAFDNDPGTKWLDFANANPATRASWIQYQYDGGEKYIVDSYTITSANDASQRDPMNWALLGSNDGVNFTTLDTRSNEDFPGRFHTRTFSFSNSTGYNVYRLDITLVADPATANSVQLAEIELIGVPDASGATTAEPSGSFSPTQPTSGPVSAEQNRRSPHDVNNDGIVSALDAVIVINQLESMLNVANTPIRDIEYFADVNGDSNVTAADALAIINYLARAQLGGTPEGHDNSAPPTGDIFDLEAEDDEIVLLLAEDLTRQLT